MEECEVVRSERRNGKGVLACKVISREVYIGSPARKESAKNNGLKQKSINFIALHLL